MGVEKNICDPQKKSELDSEVGLIYYDFSNAENRKIREK